MSTDKFESIEDFVFNRSFRNWVLDNPAADAAFWEKWMAENPDKINLLHYSKSIVYAISVSKHTLSEAEINHEIEDILKKVAANDAGNAEDKPTDFGSPSSKYRKNNYLAVAGAIAGFVALIAFFYLNTRKATEYRKQFSQ